ncbi:RNA recognition motif-containing protein [Fusarium torreyae]|uniref:RNA recognition motif-containing protein n=1 Tax=Fusarium torreyae TaxID=1237075 RepID=A0A9W8S1Z4_9HYPO|nr:RNA recognition motif-containing protein [Fusarium torreyae]
MGASKNDRKRPAEAEELDPASFEDRDNGAVKSSKRARVEERRSLFVRSLPPGATSESLTDYFSQHYPVKHATVVVDQKTKESRGYGFVTFADAEDAVEAKKALDNQDWNGRRIRIDIAEPRQRNNTTGEVPAHKALKEEIQKPAKLIVRNLPWSIKTSEQLNHLFRSFGKVKFADLPQSKGKLKGFGFVTFRGKKNAERALEAINGKEIDGRTLAVDWAVDKDTWEKQQPAEEKEEEKQGGDEEDEDDQTSSDGSEDEDEEGGAEVNRDDQLDADLKNFFKNHMENLEDEDEDDEDNQEDEEGEEAEKDVQSQAPKRTTDNTATVFIRNLPFTTTDEQLKDFFGHFGKVRYARVVMDKMTEKPAGTGFVCFFNVDDAKSCIKEAPRPQAPVAAAKNSILQDESADPDGKYTLDGRLLQVAQAVNKQEATNLADSSQAKRNEKDKRRLFLLNEGNIDRSSSLFNLLTDTEIQMRQASSAQRKKLVQGNPSLHLSLTRLALRNIPRNIDSKDLKELARKAVVEFAKDVKAGRRQPLSKEENARDGKDAKEKEHERKAKGKGIIRQAKVVFESGQGQKMQEKDGGKSRGYGFIEYTSHHWALMGLRYLNGLQLENDTGKKQRLVVEFAIENAQVVQRRRANEERSRQLNPEHNKAAKAETQPKTNAQFTKDNKKRERKGDKDGKNMDSKQAVEEGGRKGESEAEMKHRLIARTRLMRKKKAQSRGQK